MANIIVLEPGNNKIWSPNSHKLVMAKNRVVDVIAKIFTVTVTAKRIHHQNFTPGNAVTIICSYIRLGLPSSFGSFFLKMQKIWVARMTLNGEEKEGWPNS